MTVSPVPPPLKVILSDVNAEVVEAWRSAFADTPGVTIRKRAIRDEFGATLPIGSAVCVPSGAANPKFLISTPTMEQSAQDVRETLNVALACAAAFQAIHMRNERAPGSIAS